MFSSMSAGPLDPTMLDLITRLSADLRRRSGELDAILNILPVGIGIAEDPQCRQIRVNRAFAEQLGISASQNASLSAPEGERPPFKVLKDGREVPPEELPMQYAAAHGVEVLNVELDVVHPNGRRVSLYEWAVPLFDEKGGVRGAIGVFMDITERRRVEQEQRFLADASRVLASSRTAASSTWFAKKEASRASIASSPTRRSRRLRKAFGNIRRFRRSTALAPR
jgi:PAS domain S-box-containing protein